MGRTGGFLLPCFCLSKMKDVPADEKAPDFRRVHAGEKPALHCGRLEQTKGPGLRIG